MLNSSPPAHPPSPAFAGFGQMAFGQLLQREKVFGSLAALFRFVEICGCTRVLANPGTRRLILDGLCVCLHALSSFQRTDPTAASFAAAAPSNRSQGNLLMLPGLAHPVNRFLAGRQDFLNRPQNRLRFGEPSNTTKPDFPCQPLFRSVANILAGPTRTCFRRRQEMLRSNWSIGPPFARWVTSEAEGQYSGPSRICQLGARAARSQDRPVARRRATLRAESGRCAGSAAPCAARSTARRSPGPASPARARRRRARRSGRSRPP